jgi:hypothetical protein
MCLKSRESLLEGENILTALNRNSGGPARLAFLLFA